MTCPNCEKLEAALAEKEGIESKWRIAQVDLGIMDAKVAELETNAAAMREALGLFADGSNWTILEGDPYDAKGVERTTQHRWDHYLDGRILAFKALQSNAGQSLLAELQELRSKNEYYKKEFNFYFKACSDMDNELEALRKVAEASERAVDVICDGDNGPPQYCAKQMLELWDALAELEKVQAEGPKNE